MGVSADHGLHFPPGNTVDVTVIGDAGGSTARIAANVPTGCLGHGRRGCPASGCKARVANAPKVKAATGINRNRRQFDRPDSVS